MKKVILSFIFAIACLVCIHAQTKESSTKENFSEETLLKKLTASDSTQVSFKEILQKHKGKVTVIEVWASWCGDCVKAMPKLKDLQENYPGVDYVFISMDKAFDKWKIGIGKHELKGDHYWVTDGMKGAFGKSIDLDWIPRYIILDKNGKIITYRAIETDFEQMKATLKTLQ